jgi:hypothetical protein
VIVVVNVTFETPIKMLPLLPEVVVVVVVLVVDLVSFEVVDGITNDPVVALLFT